MNVNFFNNRILILYIFPSSLGILSVFSFQPFNFSIVNFFILPSIFYLIIFIKKKSKSLYRKKPFKKNLFIFSTVFGFTFYFSGVHWITNSLTFDETLNFLIPFGLILIPLFLSLFFSIPIILCGPYLNFNFSSILLFSGSFAFSDYLRSKILTGFPWNLWAYSFSWATEILQILNLLGLFAFNLILITLFSLPAILFFKVNISKKIVSLVSILLFFFIFYIYGNFTLNQNEKKLETETDKFNIKVISPNFELKYGLTDKEIERRLDQLIRISQPSQNTKTLFVWPEGAISGKSYIQILKFKKKFSENFSQNHYILFGINTFDKKKNGYYNSMIIINNNMDILQEYKKQKLVPFGEFLPFEKLLSKIGLKKITEGYGSFLKGAESKNLKLDALNILPLICYEVIFTSFIQKSNHDTNLIINISEDGWFGKSIGPDQHFAKAIFRAIEHNTFLIRSANKGTSAIINNRGQVIKKLGDKEIGNIELVVPLIEGSSRNKNDLIFYILLITYVFIFNFYRKNNV